MEPRRLRRATPVPQFRPQPRRRSLRAGALQAAEEVAIALRGGFQVRRPWEVRCLLKNKALETRSLSDSLEVKQTKDTLRLLNKTRRGSEHHISFTEMCLLKTKCMRQKYPSAHVKTKAKDFKKVDIACPPRGNPAQSKTPRDEESLYQKTSPAEPEWLP